MSEPCTVYGCIEGAYRFRDFVLYAKNKEAVDTLPEEDTWPPLDRAMFGVPMPLSRAKPGFYRIQMIHFGTCINHFDLYWADWLQKFETLLTQMYWYKAHIHLDLSGSALGNYEYLWKVEDNDTYKGFHLDPPLPVNKWTFVGGPRTFTL